MKSIALILMLGSINFGILGQYTGPVNVSDTTMSVSHVMNNIEMLAHQPDHKITVEGFILFRGDGNMYLFSDGSAKMMVHIANEHIPDIPFNDSSLVRLYGNVVFKNTDRYPHIEVESVTLMDFQIPVEKPKSKEVENETTIQIDE